MTAYDCDLSSGVCPVCGLPGRPGALRNCPSKPLPKQNAAVYRPGLGDYIAACLSAVGITKERVSAMLGVDCGCAERQEALNNWGRETLGIGRVDPPT